jgi:hypothetical protein
LFSVKPGREQRASKEKRKLVSTRERMETERDATREQRENVRSFLGLTRLCSELLRSMASVSPTPVTSIGTHLEFTAARFCAYAAAAGRELSIGIVLLQYTDHVFFFFSSLL